MKVILADKLGFCFGVKRALDMTEAAIDKAIASGEEISMLGALIHNNAVVSRLQEKGIKIIDSVDEVSDGSLVIRAHGVTQDVLKKAGETGIDVIDATCPLVERVQKAAAQLIKDGYTVYLAGDKGHAEIKSIVSAANGNVIVVATAEDIRATDPSGKVGLLFQTTKDVETASDFFNVLFEDCTEIKTIKTICSATTDRQKAIRQLAPNVDCVIVVGDRNSANTARLTSIAKKVNPKTYQVENASQLELTFFDNCNTAGVSAGASTPSWLIDEVTKYIEAL